MQRQHGLHAITHVTVYPGDSPWKAGRAITHRRIRKTVIPGWGMEGGQRLMKAIREGMLGGGRGEGQRGME